MSVVLWAWLGVVLVFGPLPSFALLRFPGKRIFIVFHLYLVYVPAR
jgi:hypothetical protein